MLIQKYFKLSGIVEEELFWKKKFLEKKVRKEFLE